MSFIVVEVTKESIEEGVAQDPDKCPLAISVGKRLNEGFFCICSRTALYIYNLEEEIEFWVYLPEIIAARLSRFDQGVKIKKFDVRFPISEEDRKRLFRE